MSKLPRGIYRHYKGNEYCLLNEARNSETKEEMVVYQDVSDENKIWARPKKMFVGEIEIDGEKRERFAWQREDADTESWEQRYKRALADYQNLLKQTAKDKEEFVKYAIADMLEDIIPVYDHLKLSLMGLNDKEQSSPWVEGVKHVLKQFSSVLAGRGVEEIKTVGEKFDHNTMEAVEGSGEHVKQELMPGYKLNGRVIRPAKVIVE